MPFFFQAQVCKPISIMCYGLPSLFPESRMIRITIVLGLVGLISGSNFDGGTPEEKLNTLLRKLEKDIAKVRGLEFKSRVVAKIIPRPPKAAKNIQGYYSIKDKRLFLYDDLSSAYERGVLIHEMV